MASLMRSWMANETEPALGFFLVYPSGRYIEYSYYYSYTGSSFFADVGGYLGLLLGHSLLSFYDIAKEGARKFGAMK